MNANEIISLLQDWVTRENRGNLDLDPCEEAILRYSLEDISYSKMSDHIPNYEFTTITNIKGPKLFKRLREVTGKEVNKKNCKLVLTQLLQPNNQEIAVRINNHFRDIDLNQAPEINDFYGRKKELSDLKQWIVEERCRLVGVLGMSGIGKTALVRELVENIQKDFDYVIWKNLEDYPSWEDILTGIESYFPCSNPETNINNRISHLVNYLNQHRCLLIFDQWEDNRTCT